MAGALEWPGRLARAHGWDYEIWTGADTGNMVYLASLRFLAGLPARRRLVRAETADAVLAAFRPGSTGRRGWPAGLARTAGLATPAPCLAAAVGAASCH